jgi:DNA polymerase III sliding clamp (beta) subunit (PCNA family)
MEAALSEYNYRGEEFEVGYSGSYLLDILRHIASDAIVFEITGAVSAALVHAPGDRTCFTLLMPIFMD